MKTLKQLKLFLEDSDYRGQHTAPDKESGVPLHDLTQGKNRVYPDDIYSKRQRDYYGTGDNKLDNDTFNIINKVRNKPEHHVMIHRAIPKDAKDTEIHPNDWVTINKDYAHAHGESALDGNYKILSKKVPAKHIFANGDSPHEQGYDPSNTKYYSKNPNI